jgi:hypothetical protein
MPAARLPACNGPWLRRADWRLLTLVSEADREETGGRVDGEPPVAPPKLPIAGTDVEGRGREPDAGAVEGVPPGDTAVAAVIEGKVIDVGAVVDMGGNCVMLGGGRDAPSAPWTGLGRVGGSVVVPGAAAGATAATADEDDESGRGSLLSGGAVSGASSAGLLAPTPASEAG